MKHFLLIRALAIPAALAAGSAFAQGAGEPSDPVLIRVSAPRPWYAPWFLVRSKMRSSIPEYQAIDGLRYKDFAINDQEGAFGGLYSYATRRQAQARYNQTYMERSRERFGSAYYVKIYSILEAIESDAQPAVREGEMIDCLVALPAGVDRRNAMNWFSARKSQLSAVAGLRRAYLIADSDGNLSLVYQWLDEAHADEGLNAAWQTQFRDAFGAAPEITRFQIPIALNNTGR
ncbi:MAG: hypothetical protein K1X75_17510 [Leptospirales bacterium]|nr:hypothetical protein [Leptospirales bacterium]